MLSVRFAALAVAALLLATLTSSVRAVTPTTFHSSIRRLSADQRSLLAVRAWRPGCPVQRRDLRLLTLTHVGFDGRPHVGQLVVNRDVAKPLVSVFRQLYALRFPIRHMRLHDFYVGQSRISERSRHHRVVRVPTIGAFALHGWQPIGPLVESRVRACHRPEPS